MRTYIIQILCATVACAISCAGNNAVFTDDFNSAGNSGRSWSESGKDDTATIEYLAEEGTDNSGCVKISNTERGAARIAYTIDGLEPGRLYRMSAMMKCRGVSEGRGAVIYLQPDGTEQPWNASEFVYGDKDWTEVYMDFMPDQDGCATICCGLGFPWGTYNGGTALGEVWYDDVRVEPVDGQMYHSESEHTSVWIDTALVKITDRQMAEWLAELDRVYEAYRELVGDVPFGGRKITIITTPGIEPGYWALAGNPILWNNHVNVAEVIERTAECDDWGFGILHEIGHVFSAGTVRGSDRWNWNDEIFANFRMSYAVEMCNGGVSQRNTIYRGEDIRNYYRIFYDETIGAGIAKNNGDALHYTFLRIKDKYGWNVYKKAFRALYAMEEDRFPQMKGSYERFMYFLSRVSEAAGEDVTKTCYTPEELRLIEESLK